MTQFPTPRECPDARIDMIRGLNPGNSCFELIQEWCDPNSPHHIPSLDGRIFDPRERAAAFQEHLYRTELYWIRADITTLIGQNINGIELSTHLDTAWIPAPDGLVFVEGGAFYKDLGPDDIPLSAISWTLYNNELFTNIWCNDIEPSEGPDARLEWFIAAGNVWPLQYPLGADEADDVGEGTMWKWIRRWMVSLFTFLNTPRVVTTDRRPAERHAARRSQRAGVDLNDTHVIYLRTASHPTGEATGTDRYHHRWIVSGHWRSQPYGPKSSKRRPIWIMPHLKGPEGAPLLGGDKVRAVIR